MRSVHRKTFTHPRRLGKSSRSRSRIHPRNRILQFVGETMKTDPAILEAQTAAQLAANSLDSETIPPEGFSQGRLNDYGRALAALKALPLSEVSNAVAPCLKDYEDTLSNPDIIVNWTKRIPLAKLAPLWRMIAVLARAVAKLQVDAKAQVIQADQNQQFLRLLGDHKKLRAMLYQHFGPELERAETLNQPLIDCAIEIMLKGKS